MISSAVFVASVALQNKLPLSSDFFKKGSVYFTADFLAARDRLELLCRQSDAIRMKRSVCHAIIVLLIV